MNNHSSYSQDKVLKMLSSIFVASFLILSISTICTYAADDGYEIEISNPRYIKQLSPNTGEKEGRIYSKYLHEMLDINGINGNIKYWDTLRDRLVLDSQKAIAGEVAAKLIFKNLGYKILEEHFENQIELCKSKLPSDKGIDGIFIKKDEHLGNVTHIIINESKFKPDGTLNLSNFSIPPKGINGHKVRQSSSTWNFDRFEKIKCEGFPFRYQHNKVIRTATQLDNNGVVTLYEIKDAKDTTIVGSFASEAHKGWGTRIIWDTHIAPKIS